MFQLINAVLVSLAVASTPAPDLPPASAFVYPSHPYLDGPTAQRAIKECWQHRLPAECVSVQHALAWCQTERDPDACEAGVMVDFD